MDNVDKPFFCKLSVQYKLLQLQKILQTTATTKTAATAQTTADKHTLQLMQFTANTQTAPATRQA